jgi:hypothetical protein
LPKQVITISRKKYAAGLFWQPVAVGSAARDYVSSIAKKIDKKLNLFVEYRSMVGLGSRKKGHRAGLSAAAPEALEAFAEYSSFLACFTVAQGFWVIAARNGIIIADMLYATEMEAKAAYASLSVLPDWGVLVAPIAWNIQRAIDKPLDDLVSGGDRNALKPLSHLRGYLIALFLIGVFGFGAFYVLRDPILAMFSPRPQVTKIDPELALEYKRRLEEKADELNQQYQLAQPPAVETEPVLLPFEEVPNKYDRAELCWRAIGFLMQPVPGWIQTTIDCDADTASARLRREYGTLADLYAVAPGLMAGIEITELSESDVMLRVNLPELDVGYSLEELDAADVMRDINSMFQLIGTEGDVRLGSEEFLLGSEYVLINFVQISVRSKLTPNEFVRVFDSIEGVSFPRITWDMRQKSWNYEVKIYVKYVK